MNTDIGEIKPTNDCRRLPIFIQPCNKPISGVSGEHTKQAAAGLRVKKRFDMGIKLRAGNIVKAACINLHGGAVLIDESSPTIEDCVFLDNSTLFASGAYLGGAIRADDSSVLIRRCTFEGNQAKWHGGAIYFESDLGYPGGHYPDGPIVEDCAFVGNTSDFDGGAVASLLGIETLVVRRCTFLNNESAGLGGALSLDSGALVSDSVLHANRAGVGGGAIRHVGAGAIRGCTITDNEAPEGGGGGSLWSNPSSSEDAKWPSTIRRPSLPTTCTPAADSFECPSDELQPWPRPARRNCCEP